MLIHPHLLAILTKKITILPPGTCLCLFHKNCIEVFQGDGQALDKAIHSRGKSRKVLPSFLSGVSPANHRQEAKNTHVAREKIHAWSIRNITMLKVLHSAPAICTRKKERKKERKGAILGLNLIQIVMPPYRNVSILSRCPSHRSVGFTTKRRCVEKWNTIEKMAMSVER